MPETLSAHLEDLESESIYILREVAAQFAKPVLLYSIGKDSSALLHLARKAFFPAKPPFPLLHIDTRWKFREMIACQVHVAQAPHPKFAWAPGKSHAVAMPTSNAMLLLRSLLPVAGTNFVRIMLRDTGERS